MVSYSRSKSIKSTIPMTLQKSTITVILIKTTIPISNLKANIPITNLKTIIPITNLKSTITQKTTINEQNNTPSTNSKIPLKLHDQSDITYNKETEQYEFKLYFTCPNSIDDNIMFSFS